MSIEVMILKPNKQSISARYLNRIGFQGSITPTLDCLNQLLILHVQNIAFGNADQFLGHGNSVDVAAIAEKLLDRGREGYCFEHNLLTKSALSELGFEALNLLGRVYYQNMHAETPPKTHLITLVRLDGELYLFDPGFGGMTPTGVLALSKINQTQETPFETFRFIPAEDAGVPTSALIGMQYMLQAYVKEMWINVYAFHPEHQVSISDVNIANWYVSTSPKSLFTQNFVLSKIDNQQRKTLNNHVMKVYTEQGIVTQQLENMQQYKDCLKLHFGLDFNDDLLEALINKLKLSSTHSKNIC